jgi:DNA-3-methyladenine glycosylase II
METRVAHLTPRPPFDFALTASHQTYYRGMSGADRFIDGIYSRLFAIDDQLALVQVRGGGSAEAPEIGVTLTAEKVGDEILQQAVRLVERVFGLDTDLRGFYALAETDSIVARLIEPFRGLRPPRTASVFEAVIAAILGQQISGAVARMLRQTLVEALGRRLEIDGTVYYAYPEPAVVAAAGVERLRALKLSTMKASYILDIASRVTEGTLMLEDLYTATNEEVAARLLPLRGVGRWTVEWVLARALGRSDAFPADDLALQRALGRLIYGEPRRLTAAEATAAGDRWGPYRGLVTTYLFAAIRNGMV